MDLSACTQPSGAWSQHDRIADAWYEAIAQACFVPYGSAELRCQLLELTEQAIILLRTEPFEFSQACAMGARLAQLSCCLPEALGRTVRTLTVHLVAGLQAEEAVALQPRVAELLDGIVEGFFRQAQSAMPAEHERLRAEIPARKQARETLEESRDEIEDNLIRDVSHELRTPLAKVQMGLQFMLEMLEHESIDRQRARRTGEMVLANVEQLLETIEAILDLSALDAGCVGYERISIQPQDLVADAVVYMRPMAAVKGLELVSKVDDDLPLLEGDLDQLFRVMINLIDNAIKFTDEGTVTVAVTRAAEKGVEIAVLDSGCGIAKENLDRVFERFFRASPRYQGAGVGLTICRWIVEAHGGRIWAESEGQGHGTVVRLVLPEAVGQRIGGMGG
jgi:signal transduction histidine kinase